MADATLEQRIEWLQNELREIGKMCLKLGGDPSAGARAWSRGTGWATFAPAVSASHPVTAAAPAEPVADVSALGLFLGSVGGSHAHRAADRGRRAISMLGQVYAHLPLDRAMHGMTRSRDCDSSSNGWKPRSPAMKPTQVPARFTTR